METLNLINQFFIQMGSVMVTITIAVKILSNFLITNIKDVSKTMKENDHALVNYRILIFFTKILENDIRKRTTLECFLINTHYKKVELENIF